MNEENNYKEKQAIKSQVLLKNNGNIVPLKEVKKIFVIDNIVQKKDFADDNDMINKRRIQKKKIIIKYNKGWEASHKVDVSIDFV